MQDARRSKKKKKKHKLACYLINIISRLSLMEDVLVNNSTVDGNKITCFPFLVG